MSKRITVHETLICDLGLNGEHAATSTVSVGAHGQWYELDLCDSHANEVDGVLDPIVRRGRKSGTKRKVRGHVDKADKAHKDENAQIRAWAKAKGVEIPRTGRIPGLIRAQWAESQARRRSRPS